MDPSTELACAARDCGDRQALEAFVREMHADVWRLCAHLGGRDRADDLAQEVHVRVLRSLRGFRAESSVRSWLYSIVRRVVADDIANRQRRRREPVVQLGTQPDHQGDIALTALIHELDDDRRAAFVLTQLMGYSYAEAAQFCACPVGTIRSRVARAREHLIALLLDTPGGTSFRDAAGPRARRSA